MGWLKQQIRQDNDTQSERFLRRFVNLMHMRNYTEVEPFTLSQVDEVFNTWLEKEAIQNPAYRRRYLMTQQDLHRLFAEEEQCLPGPGTFSQSGQQLRPKENNSPALPQSPKSSTVGAEKEDTSMLQPTGHHTPMSTDNQPESSENVERIGIGKLDGSDRSPHGVDYLSRQQSDIHSQSGDAEAVTVARETAIVDSSPDTELSRSSMETNRRGQRPNLLNDYSESFISRKTYVCKRCNKPGHAIQHCPTNLDSTYDRAPSRDYQCKFCGRHGNHYATLCPKNPREGSLTKQRERAKTKNQEPRTPNQSGKHHYQDQETSAIHARDRHRSRSPRRRSQDHYRTRSFEHRRPFERGAYGYSPRTGNEDDRYWPPSSGEPDISPYTSRARLTRRHMSLDYTKGTESPSRSGDDTSRLEQRHDSSSALHYARSHSSKRVWQWHKDLDKVTTSNEGRLAYDDDVDTLGEPKSSPCPSVTNASQHAISIDEEETDEAMMPPVIEVPESLDKAKDEIEDFLCALEADIMLKREYNPQTVGANSRDAKVEVGCGPSRDTYTGDSNYSDVITGPESPAAETTPSPKYRKVQCPPFSPEVVSLFYKRENPIIHVKAKRSTADQLMEKSEGCWAHRSRQAQESLTAHESLPCRPR
ncbi:hypothetical protein F5Y01DRAFT_304716 [Xylaria sp. FL0043]|nr:hypothetical protein F5Y01DRAFT_304716 [Xylaria sp. FL0043]